jgi:hypothetical protein
MAVGDKTTRKGSGARVLKPERKVRAVWRVSDGGMLNRVEDLVLGDGGF